MVIHAQLHILNLVDGELKLKHVSKADEEYKKRELYLIINKLANTRHT
jgi:hypothetical protein